MNADEIVDIVTGSLAKHRPSGYGFDVNKDSIRQDGNWWYLVVTPTNPDARAYDYDRILSQTEDEIEQQEHIKILLVPALAA